MERRVAGGVEGWAGGRGCEREFRDKHRNGILQALINSIFQPGKSMSFPFYKLGAEAEARRGLESM